MMEGTKPLLPDAGPPDDGARWRRPPSVAASDGGGGGGHSEKLRVGKAWRPAIQYHAKATLGTVMGVYVPCMLSIIGVILFLRLGWAVGQAGVLGVLAMFALGGTMALLTDLSLSAMATNGKISAGGTYYLISRSVGPELGGAIGVMFYLANTLGIAFYLQVHHTVLSPSSTSTRD